MTAWSLFHNSSIKFMLSVQHSRCTQISYKEATLSITTILSQLHCKHFSIFPFIFAVRVSALCSGQFQYHGFEENSGGLFHSYQRWTSSSTAVVVHGKGWISKTWRGPIRKAPETRFTTAIITPRFFHAGHWYMPKSKKKLKVLLQESRQMVALDSLAIFYHNIAQR